MNLADLLKEQGSSLSAMIALLRDEQSVLVKGEVDGELLAELAEAKQPLLNAIERLEIQRLDGQSALGYERDAASSEMAVTRAGCLEQWQVVQDLTRQAAHLNQLNGSLIQHRLAHNQRVLKNLRQLSGTPLYGADGQTHKMQGRIQSSA